MDSIRSIRVPAKTVRRVRRVTALVLAIGLPSAATVTGGLVAAMKWLGFVTITDVAVQVADVKVIADAAQRNAFAVEQRVRDLRSSTVLAWSEIVLLRAELEVWRRFPDVAPKRRGELVEDARSHYARYYEAQLREFPGEPQRAADETFKLHRWKPPN